MGTTTTTYRKRKLNGCMNKSVQDPTCAQSFNKYAYCMNNPLRYVDPSGWQMVGGSTPKHYDWRDKEVPYEPRDFREGSSYMMNCNLHGASLYRPHYSGGSGYKSSSWSLYGNEDGSCDGNGNNTSDTSGPMTGDGDYVNTDADGTIVIEHENGIKETRYSDGRILIYDMISKVGYIVADQSATQWANFNMNYYILYNPDEPSIYISCLSSNSEVMAGDVFAGAGATVIAGDEYSKYESLLGDNQTHLYEEGWNYVGSAKFVIPSDCGFIQVNVIGSWSINTGYGITLPTIAPLCPYPINANKTYYVKP